MKAHAIDKLNRLHWWSDSQLPKYLEANPDFAAWWSPSERSAKSWTSADYAVNHRAFLIYEADARITQRHLFGSPVALLNWDALSAICRPFHSIKGDVSGYGYESRKGPSSMVNWLAHSQNANGPALVVEGDTVANSFKLEYLVRTSTGEKSAKRVAINLLASDRAIRKELQLRKCDIGLPAGASITDILATVKSRRRESGLPEAKSLGTKQDVQWDWLEYLDFEVTGKGPRRRSRGDSVFTRSSELRTWHAEWLRGGGGALAEEANSQPADAWRFR